MGVFKRLRDSATGLFISKSQFDILPKARTVEEQAFNVRVKLRIAVAKAERAASTTEGYMILRNAALDILGPDRRGERIDT